MHEPAPKAPERRQRLEGRCSRLDEPQRRAVAAQHNQLARPRLQQVETVEKRLADLLFKETG